MWKMGLKNILGQKRRLVAQSVMSATDTLGHWDVHGLSAIDPTLLEGLCPIPLPQARAASPIRATSGNLLSKKFCW